MPARYFDKFPTITYSNTTAVDITKRTALLERVSDNPYVFYPYEITSNERADQLSARYYEDQYKSWILYFSNKIVDPYYEWYLSQNEFTDFIVKKYGSYYDAESRIKNYRNNWLNQETISVSAFESLAYSQKKYWEPNYGSSNRITGYSRKQVDWIINTNKIVSIAANSATYQAYTDKQRDFVKDEICTIYFDQYHQGRGQVLLTSNSNITLQHLSGDFLASGEVVINANSYIYGHESTVNTKFIATTLIANNFIDGAEEVYWSPVTYLDYEIERNEFNKTIRVIDSSLKQTVVDNLKTLMKE